MPEPERSPLARLVLFIVCLSAVAALAAGIHYLAIDLPLQKTVPPAPENTAAYSCLYKGGQYYYVGCIMSECPKKCCNSPSEMTFIGYYCFSD